MSARSHALVMLRRNAKHIARNPTSVFNAVLMPIVVMLMFVYMMGDAFDVGVDYIDYATPGLILLAVCYGLGATATSVNSDMTKGIINRFKVMDVSRGAVLTGHVIASLLTNLLAIAALIGVAFLLGFRPAASPLDWLGVAGIVVLLAVATGWLTVALGLAAKSPETAGLAAVPLVMLPFFSSAIVPAEKMGAGLRQFAEYQPFTPVIETLRGLLNGAPDTGDTLTAVAWCTGIGLAGYLWARATFKKRAWTSARPREQRAERRVAMPIFVTPGPVAATVVLAGARMRVTASDRTDTVVRVEPVDRTSRSHVRVAGRTRVDFAGGRLSVKTTTPGDRYGSVAVTIDLPAGSSLLAYLAHTSVHADGSLGDCELHLASGRVGLDRITALQATITAGEVAIGHVAGHATIRGSTVRVRIGRMTRGQAASVTETR